MTASVFNGKGESLAIFVDGAQVYKNDHLKPDALGVSAAFNVPRTKHKTVLKVERGESVSTFEIDTQKVGDLRIILGTSGAIRVIDSVDGAVLM